MRKILHITMSFIALAMFISCQKAQTEKPSMAGVTQFSATILQTKTVIDSDGKVTWVAGDEIIVTDAAEPANSAVYVAQTSGASTTFTLKSGETAVTTAPFTATYGDITDQRYSATGANCLLTAPETNTTDFTFSSPYAVLKITAKSEVEKTISQVIVKDGVTHLSTLTCGDDGVVLSATGTVFYITVATGDLANLNITFETVTNSSSKFETATKERKSAVKLAAGDLLPLTLNFKEGDWNEPACIAAGTMITMENGEQKAVEELEINEVIRTVDHMTGKVSSAPVCFIWKTENVSNVFTLTFECGVEVDVIEEHGFYDQEKSKYAFINAYNAKDYIGHHFYNADNGSWLELKSCKRSDKRVDAYAIVTSKHLNHLSNSMLSMCDGSIKVLANLFEFDSQLMFNADKMAANIEKFGLTPLEKILEYKGFNEDDYYNYNLQYLNVAIGKGLISWDHVKALSDYCELYVND